jgi:hypothetical protein
MALAWPGVLQSQRHPRPGQSRGFQAKPGHAQHYTRQSPSTRIRKPATYFFGLYELVQARTSQKSGKADKCARNLESKKKLIPNSFSGEMEHKKTHIFFEKLTSKKANGYFPDERHSIEHCSWQSLVHHLMERNRN